MQVAKKKHVLYSENIKKVTVIQEYLFFRSTTKLKL